MKLVKKLKIKINEEAKEYFDFASEKCRLIYNFALSEKRSLYENNKQNVSIYELKKRLPELKEKYPEYKQVYNKCLSAMYFRLQDAYNFFFKKYNKFPKFKRKGNFISQEYPGMYIKRQSDNTFILPTGKGRKSIIARAKEKLPINFGTVTISRKSGKYFANFLVEEDIKNQENNNEILAIDLGVKTLVTGISTKKEFVEVGKFSHYTKHLDLLRSQRDKKQKYSRRYKKGTVLLNKKTQKYLNRVNDYLHKASNYITEKRSESTIIVGDLNLKPMKTEESWFNRIIQNEWRVGSFVRMLSYKAIKFGKTLIKINEKNTTKMCSQCGNLKSMSLSDRIYKCEKCGFEFDRDRNSALNILKKYCSARAIKINLDEFRSPDLRNLKVESFFYI